MGLAARAHAVNNGRPVTRAAAPKQAGLAKAVAFDLDIGFAGQPSVTRVAAHVYLVRGVIAANEIFLERRRSSLVSACSLLASASTRSWTRWSETTCTMSQTRVIWA